MLFHAAIVALALLSTVSSEGIVAFSASLSKHTTLIADQVVVFGAVDLNQGNAYDNTTGVFTATKGGLYQFHIALLSQDGKLAYTRLYKNDEIIASVWGIVPNAHTTAGNSVISQLKKGDRVFVKSAGNSFLHGDVQKYSTFSGVLIAPWD